MSLHVAVSGWLLGPPSGANRRLLALVRHAAPLLAPDERLTVLHGPGFAPAVADRAPGVDWRAVSIPAGPTLRRALAERRALPRLLRELAVDVLDHGLLPLPRVPCPVVWTAHDVRDLDLPRGRPRWLVRATLRRAFARSRCAVAPSAFTRARLLDVASGARVEVLPNGVVLPPPAAAAIADHVLHVGHLEPRKNLDVLVRALALLPAAQRPRLVLAGADAGSGPGLRALARRLGVADLVELPGVVDEARLATLYATARAVVVPSRHEGFGLCALEGLAHGRPVLVAMSGALPEVVGDQATVLPPDDPAAWARALAAVADDGLDDAALRAARRRRAAGFAWPEIARRWLALCREAATS